MLGARVGLVPPLLHPWCCSGGGDARAVGVFRWVWEERGRDKRRVAGNSCLSFPTPAVGSLSSLFWGHQGIAVLGGGHGRTGRRSLPTARVWQLLLGKGRKNPYPFLKGFGGLKRHVQARKDRPGLGKQPWWGRSQLVTSPLGQAFYLNTLPVPAILTACFSGALHRWLQCCQKPTLHGVRAARRSLYHPQQHAETPQPSGVPSPPSHP